VASGASNGHEFASHTGLTEVVLKCPVSCTIPRPTVHRFHLLMSARAGAGCSAARRSKSPASRRVLATGTRQISVD